MLPVRKRNGDRRQGPDRHSLENPKNYGSEFRRQVGFRVGRRTKRRSGLKRCEAAQRIFRETRRWREADAVGRRCACGRQNAPVIATNVLLRSPLDNDARRSGRLGDASASERAALPYVVLCEMEWTLNSAYELSGSEILKVYSAFRTRRNSPSPIAPSPIAPSQFGRRRVTAAATRIFQIIS